MKKINFIILTVFTLLLIACSDELNQKPISNIPQGDFYKNTQDFQQAVNGIYNALGANPQTINGYAIRRFDLSETRSDNVYSPGTGVRDWNPINNFSKTISTNSYVNEAWNSNYLGIYRANIVLDKLNATVVPDSATRVHLEGEAKFLRAFFYFDLVRWFGKVPLIKSAITTAETLNVPQSAVADVYAQIIEDLNVAIKQLPVTYFITPAPSAGSPDVGRATSLAAKAILGLVYLTRTGKNYGIDGPGMETNEYAQAISLFTDVINSGKYNMVSPYASIFSYTNENNAEIIFDIQAIGGSSGDVGVGARFPTEMVDALYAAAQKITFAGGVDSDSPKSPSADLISSFEPGDKRLPTSYLASFVSAVGTPVTTGLYIKFWDASKKGADRFNWSINYPVLRYTDVLMMKAEAILRGGVGGTQADVDAIVNLVRTRAGLSGLSNVTLAQLLNERRHEFMAEGLRWHDLVRNGVLVTTMNAWKAVGDPQGKLGTITENDIIYPIPNTQIIVQPGLYTQNPGYN